MRWGLLVLLAGCGVPVNEPLDVLHGDTAFSAEERQAIESALMLMAERTAAPRFAVVWDGDITSVYTSRIVREVPPESLAGKPTRGLHTSSSVSGAHRIRIAPGLPIVEVGHVMEHETGHAYGLLDIAEPGVMGDAEGVWTAADITECRRAGLCLAGTPDSR